MDKYVIELLFWAEQDMNEIGQYYKSISNKLGDKFYYEARKSIENLKINPFYQTDFGSIRKIPVNKFPYKVFFRVDEENKIVYIEAIISNYLLPFSTKIK